MCGPQPYCHSKFQRLSLPLSLSLSLSHWVSISFFFKTMNSAPLGLGLGFLILGPLSERPIFSLSVRVFLSLMACPFGWWSRRQRRRFDVHWRGGRRRIWRRRNVGYGFHQRQHQHQHHGRYESEAYCAHWTWWLFLSDPILSFCFWVWLLGFFFFFSFLVPFGCWEIGTK